ncbi:MAG: cysteine hydrolase, partial [Candidatus Binatia bacterium]
IPATLAELVDPRHTALLLWDMENAIAPNAFNYKDILGNLKMLAARARTAGVPVFYSVQTAFDLLKEEAPVWIRVRMKRAKASDPAALLKEKEDPKGREIVDELKPQAQDIVFQKRRPDGFVGTDFDLTLRSNRIRTILIGGVATEGGVEGTARTARNLGYDIVVLKDCVGSRSRELHELALKLMEQTHFDISTAGEISTIWQTK